MPSYKLTYFDATGRAELTRLLFKLGGQEFEDVRVPKAEWPKLKPTMPLSTVPVLEVKVDLEDDVMIIPQSSSMERYVARTVSTIMLFRILLYNNEFAHQDYFEIYVH